MLFLSCCGPQKRVSVLLLLLDDCMQLTTHLHTHTHIHSQTFTDVTSYFFLFSPADWKTFTHSYTQKTTYTQVWFQNRRSKERRMKQLNVMGSRRHFFRSPRRAMRPLRPGSHDDTADSLELHSWTTETSNPGDFVPYPPNPQHQQHPDPSVGPNPGYPFDFYAPVGQVLPPLDPPTGMGVWSAQTPGFEPGLTSNN